MKYFGLITGLFGYCWLWHLTNSKIAVAVLLMIYANNLSQERFKKKDLK